jgi:tRNA U34 5-methylaminomethyl-2-thiouridine-forming methyltransferase MnmC
MAAPQRLRTPTSHPRLQWLLTDDGSRTLWDQQLDETYHSGCGAVAESFTVYLSHSGVLAQLQSRASTRVLEYGFGTATAFLLTAAAAEIYNTPLTYRGLELELLPSDIFASLDLSADWPDVPKWTNQILPSQPTQQPTIESEPRYGVIASNKSSEDSETPTASIISVSDLLERSQQLLRDFVRWRSSLPLCPPEGIYVWQATDQTRLELVIGDAVHYQPTNTPPFDAVYFDPFSPANAPQLWSERVFQVAFDSLRDHATLTSYCVKGAVRSRLAKVGFVVQKVAGPRGGKREVLIAHRPTTDLPTD